MSSDTTIHCYVRDGAEIDIHPARSQRAWMDATANRHAYRCLPLGIANSHGWEIRCPQTVTATWNGGPLTTDVSFAFEGPLPADGNPPTLSAFGSGIVTFHVPCLFRTPPGIDLWVMGPVNHIKDGIQPLVAVVETDWLTEAGFTMNWKLTRPDHPVRFARGEPYCFITPMPRGLIESMVPRLHRFDDDPALREQYYGAEQRRRQFQAQELGMREQSHARYVTEERADRWQRTYFQGRDAHGNLVDGHRTKLNVARFQFDHESD